MQQTEAQTLPFTRAETERTMDYNGEPVLSYSLCRPVFPKDGPTARLERYFAQMARGWQERWEKVLYQRACAALCAAREASRPFESWQARLEFTVTWWEEPLLSLYLDARERTSVRRPVISRQGETWNCATGWPRTLRSFFPPGDHHWRSRVIRQLQESALERLDSGESLLDPDCAHTLSRAYDPERFYLTEQGLAIFYPLYLLGPFAEGLPTFTIPLPELVPDGM